MAAPDPKLTHEREGIFNPTVIRLGLISLFADISSEMLYPITPIFLTTVLGASMTSVGLIEGVAEALASLLKVYAGAWSDRLRKRRVFVAAGYLLSALAKPLTGVAHSWLTVLTARGLDRTGKGLRGAPRDAMLAEAVDPSLHGAAFGWHRTMDTIGAAIGPLLAVWYLHSFSDANPENLRSVYWFALGPGLIAFAFTLKLQDPRRPAAREKEKEMAPKMKWREISSSYKTYLASWAIFSLVNSSDVFLLMRAKQSGLTLTTVIFLYCFYNLTYALLSTYFGRLSDRIGRKYILASGLVVFAAVYGGFAWATELWQFCFLFGVYGIYMAATDGVGKALAVDLILPEHKATGIGLLGAVTGVATIVASVVAGSLWDHVGPAAPFLFGAFGALTAAIF